MKTELLFIFGLTIGNFSYEAFTSQDWERAFDHSYYQAMACLAMALCLWLEKRRVGVANVQANHETKL